MGAAVQPPRPDGSVESSHGVAAVGRGMSDDSLGPCLAIGGVQARLIATGAAAGPTAAAAAQPSMPSAPADRSVPFGKHKHASAAKGPDPDWVPQFVASYADDERAARGAAVQLPPPRAPLQLAFESAVAALPVRCCRSPRTMRLLPLWQSFLCPAEVGGNQAGLGQMWGTM